jgi:hypothetical protein
MGQPRFEVPRGTIDGVNTDKPVKGCPACKEAKPLREFGNDKYRPDGKNTYCKVCRRTKQQDYYSSNRESELAKQKEKRLEWHGVRSDTPITRTTASNRLIRLEVLGKLGGRCQCCGEDREEFLSLDHINGGGTKHRAESGTYIFRRIRKDPDPLTYQVLCYNCNISRGVRGYCPCGAEANHGTT